MRARDGRLVSASTVVTGIIVPLYDDTNWPILTQALEQIRKGRTETVHELSAERVAPLGSGQGQRQHRTVSFDQHKLAHDCLICSNRVTFMAVAAIAAQILMSKGTP